MIYCSKNSSCIIVTELEKNTIIYGTFLIVTGVMVLSIGIMNLISFNPLVGSSLDPLIARIVGMSARTDLIIAVWGIISGYGLIREYKWAWGTSSLIFTYIIIKFLNDSIQGIWLLSVNPLLGIYGICIWIYIILFIMGVSGIIYLLVTKYFFDEK